MQVKYIKKVGKIVVKRLKFDKISSRFCIIDYLSQSEILVAAAKSSFFNFCT